MAEMSRETEDEIYYVGDKIADLLCRLHETNSASDIARHFDRKRKWLYYSKKGTNFVISPEFIAGLRNYGYDLKLVKIGGE